MAAQDSQTFNLFHPGLDDKQINLLGAGGNLLLAVSFFLIIMFTILYMLCVCHRRNGSADSRSVSSSSNTTVHRIAGLDPRTISNIPVRLYHSSEGHEDAQCSICLVGFAEGDNVKALPTCNHDFHPACVDEWLKTQSNCPLCRGSLGGAHAPGELELVVH